jgi:hypothetical protein
VSRIKIQLDEDCQAHALPEGLRQHGIDAKTTIELGLTGVDDETQLKAAGDAGRVLVSNNICDFVPLHEKWLAKGRFHAGIVVFHQQVFSVGEIIRRLAKLVHTLSAQELRGRLEWLNNWGAN